MKKSDLIKYVRAVVLSEVKRMRINESASIPRTYDEFKAAVAAAARTAGAPKNLITDLSDSSGSSPIDKNLEYAWDQISYELDAADDDAEALEVLEDAALFYLHDALIDAVTFYGRASGAGRDLWRSDNPPLSSTLASDKKNKDIVSAIVDAFLNSFSGKAPAAAPQQKKPGASSSDFAGVLKFFETFRSIPGVKKLGLDKARKKKDLPASIDIYVKAGSAESVFPSLDSHIQDLGWTDVTLDNTDEEVLGKSYEKGDQFAELEVAMPSVITLYVGKKSR